MKTWNWLTVTFAISMLDALGMGPLDVEVAAEKVEVVDELDVAEMVEVVEVDELVGVNEVVDMDDAVCRDDVEVKEADVVDLLVACGTKKTYPAVATVNNMMTAMAAAVLPRAVLLRGISHLPSSGSTVR